MTTFIEKDALNSDWQPATGELHNHAPAPLKSFYATPRMDPTLMDRFRSLFKSELRPGQFITKGADGLRHMFIITSNSYLDRDDETITSKALEAYEASCYPGDGLFHCDNPLLWWHDDDVVMGDIEAVNYSTPFLVEVAKERPTPTARILWDYAEANGDNAGASHRFGYRDEDRKADGSYTHIVKQETTYLPERNLAANLMTYAGVIDKTMSTKQSDDRLNEIFAQATGGKIKDAAAMIHAKSGELDKALEKLGITHKAKAENPAAPDEEAAAVAAGEAAAEDMPEEKAEGTLPADFIKRLEMYERLHALVMEIAGAQTGMMDDMEGAIENTTELAKAFAAHQAKEKAATDSLEKRLAIVEGKLLLTQRRASQEASTDPEKLKDAVNQANEAAKNANLVDSPFGKILPPLDYK